MTTLKCNCIYYESIIIRGVPIFVVQSVVKHHKPHPIFVEFVNSLFTKSTKYNTKRYISLDIELFQFMVQWM